MKMFVKAIAAIAILSTSACCATALEASKQAQLSRLLTERSVEVLGPRRPDALPQGVRIVPENEVLEGENCQTIIEEYDRDNKGTFRRNVCTGRPQSAPLHYGPRQQVSPYYDRPYRPYAQPRYRGPRFGQMVPRPRQWCPPHRRYHGRCR